MMRLRLRKTVRRVLLLFVAFSTFAVGLSAFYLYTEAAGFLFKPKQPTSETTTTLMTRPAPPPVSQRSFTFSTPESYRAWKATQQAACRNCVEDKDFGLCELLDGEYVNDIYRYTLRIPPEVEAMRSPAPAPNHGFVARVLAGSNAVIYVDGSYDASFLNSTRKAASEELRYLREEYGESAVLLEWKNTRLGKRAAIRYRAQYTDTSTGVTMIEEAVIALRKDSSHEDEVGIIYSLTLRTPVFSHKENSAVFEKILKSWRELEMDGG
jgi:hypothetical protein